MTMKDRAARSSRWRASPAAWTRRFAVDIRNELVLVPFSAEAGVDLPHGARIRRLAALIDDRGNRLFLSDASIWEIVLKHGAGKLPLPEEPPVWIPRQVEFFQLEAAPVTAGALYGSGELPGEHRDPFDRLLAAQAKGLGLTILSPDPAFGVLGVDHDW